MVELCTHTPEPEGPRPCRAVWPGIDVFLCIWHVLAAWSKQLRQKLGPGKGARFQQAFDAMYAMMMMRALPTPEATLAALSAMADTFADTFKDDPAIVTYFQSHWLPKLGAQPPARLHA